jgi:hypothetical protein
MYLVGFTDPKLFLGVFGWPDLSRLYKLFVHSNRSLYPAQTHLLFAFIFGYQVFARSKVPRTALVFAVIVFINYLLFELTFRIWHGGSCYGARFMTGAFVMMAIFAIPAYQKFPKTFLMLLFVSYVTQVATY